MERIDVTAWRKFRIGDYFVVNNTGNALVRDIDDGSGTTPFVTAKGVNNGVSGYVDAGMYDLTKGNCILVGGKTFTLTYQKDDFVSNDSHNFSMRLKTIAGNEGIYLFLITVIHCTLRQKYSWGDAVTKEKILDEEIRLPSTGSGTPDWNSMEDYIRNETRKIKQNIDAFLMV